MKDGIILYCSPVITLHYSDYQVEEEQSPSDLAK